MNPTTTDQRSPARGFLAALGRTFLRSRGWRIEGGLPPVDKAVVIAAPHTTNWDMPYMLAVAWALGVRPSWLGKKSLFRAPFGGFMRWLGGIAVDRGVRSNVVEQIVERFRVADRLFLVVPPSGTRSRAPGWKSGFYHIARGADVPILCSFLDYPRRIGGLGLAIRPTGHVREDMDRIREFYADKRGKYPELETPIRLLDEDGAAADPVRLSS